jgi:hypothetical protein
VVGKRERKARERERKRNIVALLLLLLLRRTAATVLEHVLPVLFALSFLGPTHTHLAHICALLLGLLGLLRVPDERVFAILVLVVVARAVAALTVAANKTSSRVDADEKGLRTMADFVLPALGKTIPARGRRRGRERRRRSQSGKGKGKENPKRESAFEASSVLQKREREREKKPFERAVALTVDFARVVFPDKSIRRGKRTSRARNARAHRFAKL